MKSRTTGSDSKARAAHIVEVLAQKVPDHFLREYFCGMAPEQVRRILLETAKMLTPPQGKAVRPETQPSLFGDDKKTWKGKLAGQILQLYSDGASRGNPGQAGVGIAILDGQGNELVGTGKYLGQCTNNEAEYRALLLGLDKCSMFGSGRLKVHLDSELIVKQIHGDYKVKHPNLKPLFQQVMQKLSRFASFSVTHVRREKNQRADELANRAIDEHMQ